LAQPLNYHFIIKYAEILYTIGGYDSLKLAKKYFACALELNDGNLKGLYGLCLSIIAIGSTKQGRQEKDTDNTELFDWAFARLEQEYSSKSPEKLPLLKSLLRNKEKDKSEQ